MMRVSRLLLLVALVLWGSVAVAADMRTGETRVSAASAEPIPFKREEPVTGAFVAKMAVVLLVLLGATAGGLYLARRIGAVPGRAPGGQKIETLDVRRLTPRLTLFLVRVRGREVLLAQNADTLVVVGEGYEKLAAGDAAETKGGS